MVAHTVARKKRIPYGALDEFTRAYLDCLFFTELPEHKQRSGNFLEWHDTREAWEEFTAGDQNRIRDECEKFQRDHADNLKTYPLDRAGHDLMYSRNGHGCGYWENDFGDESDCKALQEGAKRLKHIYLFRSHGRYYLDPPLIGEPNAV